DRASDAMRRLVRLSETYPLEPLNATSEVPLLAGLKRVEMDLAERRPREALERADMLLAKCHAWGRNPVVVKLKLLAIRAHLDLRNRPRAISALQDALQLGRRCGLVRTFLDAGPQVTDLMRTLFSTDSEDAELLGYLDRLIGKDAKVNAAPGKSLSRKATAAPPVEMLTER